MLESLFVRALLSAASWVVKHLGLEAWADRKAAAVKAWWARRKTPPSPPPPEEKRGMVVLGNVYPDGHREGPKITRVADGEWVPRPGLERKITIIDPPKKSQGDPGRRPKKDGK